jgi:hypothetical protein
MHCGGLRVLLMGSAVVVEWGVWVAVEEGGAAVEMAMVTAMISALLWPLDHDQL